MSLFSLVSMIPFFPPTILLPLSVTVAYNMDPALPYFFPSLPSPSGSSLIPLASAIAVLMIPLNRKHNDRNGMNGIYSKVHKYEGFHLKK